MAKESRWKKIIAGLLPWTPWIGLLGFVLTATREPSIGSQLRQTNTPVTDVLSKAEDDLERRLNVLQSIHPVAEGSWTIPDSPWELRSWTASSDEISQHLGPNLERAKASLGSASAEHQVVLDLLPKFGSKTYRDQGITWRSREDDEFRLSVCYREEDEQIWVLYVVLAMSTSNEQWQLIQLTPARFSSKTGVHLLPLSGKCDVRCQRFSTDGVLQCEIIELNNDFRQQLTLWREHGWVVVEEESDSRKLANAWMCIQNDRVVRVQQNLSADASVSELVLTAINDI